MADFGELVRVNLTTGEIRREKIPEKIYELFPGGKALGYYIVARHVPPGTDALSPKNIVVFAPGALSGLVPGASKVAVVGLSPETSLINDSYAGDRFGPYLRRWGIAALVIHGKSEKPVYLKMGEKVKIMDASELWGMGVYSATEQLWMKHGDGAVAIIGPAGENMVRFANIMFDTERAAGRGGLGAVLGAKGVKGIFVEPISAEEMKIDVNREILEKIRDEYYQKLVESASPILKEYGTTNALISSGKRGMSPAYNFKKPFIDESLSSKLSGKVVKKYEIEPERFIHGKSCPVKCARYVEIERDGEKFRVKPEYESIGMLGAATGVFDFPEVAHMIHLANDLGLDAIAAGNVIGWFFEMVERGEMGMEEAGFEVSGFGDAHAEEKLLIHIAYRMGIGAVLAEGVKRASEILNRGKEYAVHVKGLEAPAWDPRGLRTYALSYATADVGASHMRGWPSPRSLPNDGPAKDLVPSLIEDRDSAALFDTLGLCMFVPYQREDMERLFREIMGEKAELKHVGWRVETLARVYNLISGLEPLEDDIIPQRWWEPEEEGPAAGNMAFRSKEDFEEARKEFYRLRGWSECGIPTEDTLVKLNVKDIVKDICKYGGDERC